MCQPRSGLAVLYTAASSSSPCPACMATFEEERRDHEVMRLTTVVRGGRYNSRAMRSDTENAPPALEAKNISRLYKSSGRGVSDVSFRVERGEVFGFMGPNG